jgi:hypothetical protein
MVRLQLSDERRYSVVAEEAKLGGGLPRSGLRAPIDRVVLVEEPVILRYGWVLGNAVHDEWERALYIQLVM